MKRPTMKAALAGTVIALAAQGLGLSAETARAEELRMSWWGGDARHAATQAALAACGAKYGHTVKGEFTGFDGYLEKLTTQIAGGTEADIMQVNWPWLPLLSRDGTGFADLHALPGIDLSQWGAADLASGEIDGHLQGIPVSTAGRVFFFNRTTFERAGLSVPTSWSELLDATPVIKAKLGEDFYPFNAARETAQLIVTLVAVQRSGKDMVDPATNRVAWSQAELSEAIGFLGTLAEKGVLRSQKQEAADGNVNLFEKPQWASGQIAGSYEWDSTWEKYGKPLQEGQVVRPVPFLHIDGALTDGVYRKPSMVFSISKHSPHPEAAAQIVNCLLNEPEGVAALGVTRGLPSSTAAMKLLGDEGDPVLRAAHEIVMQASGPTLSPFNENPEIRGIFLDTLEEFAYGQLDADAAAEQMIEGFNEVLAEYD